MNEYPMNENLNFSFGSPEAAPSSDEQKNKSLKHLLGNREQRTATVESFFENSEGRLLSPLNIHGAFRAFDELMERHQEPAELSKEIIRVFTELLQVDGVCIYQTVSNGTLEVLACNSTWSTIAAAIQEFEEFDNQNILIHPAVFSVHNAGRMVQQQDPLSKATPVSLGVRNYGALLSLPLVCGGTPVGAISLFSVHPQFFLPERTEILRTAASLTAALFMNIQAVKAQEKNRRERIALQQDVLSLREQVGAQHSGAVRGSGDEAAYKELEALSYSVSHDLRGPILAIRNLCDWLSTQHAANLDTEGQNLLRQITASSDHMEQLLDGLLAFSKVVQLDPQQSLIDMTALVRTVVDELMKNESGSSSLSISVRPLLPATGDATLMRQVWTNLLSNALKYTRYKQKREVNIESHPFNGGAQYCVSDNGVGFDMQYVDRLFGAFHRLHLAEEFEGTGVGLAIVQRIVHRHGGRVWAEGKVDEGAQFYFTLPTGEKTSSETGDKRS
ncbi:MAG: GAF domain-containing protein [Ignavibacteriae bacterium]|nr:MAG: GAF domain-containing protein [Ignavibacteriota bacterium]